MPGAYVVATSSIRRLKECILHLDTRFFFLISNFHRSVLGEARRLSACGVAWIPDLTSKTEGTGGGLLGCIDADFRDQKYSLG